MKIPYFLKRVKYFISSLWWYLPVIWNDSWYDWSAMLKWWEVKFKRDAQLYRKKGRTTASPGIADEMEYCVKQIERIFHDPLDDLSDEEWKALSKEEFAKYCDDHWEAKKDALEKLSVAIRTGLYGWWD